MTSKTNNQFIQFLIKDLAISSDSVKFALRQTSESTSISLLPMVLWQYGLITLCQLEKMWDWLETA